MLDNRSLQVRKRIVGENDYENTPKGIYYLSDGEKSRLTGRPVGWLFRHPTGNKKKLIMHHFTSYRSHLTKNLLHFAKRNFLFFKQRTDAF